MNHYKSLFVVLLLSSLSACYAQTDAQTNNTSKERDLIMQEDYTKRVAHPALFDPRRKQFKCTKWNEPSIPDEASKRWYQAATTIHAKKYRLSPAEYQKMLILYEGAARKGHWKAVNNLITIYSEGGMAMGDQFKPEPEKARYWLHYGLDKGWDSAYEWLSYALNNGYAGYRRNSDLSLAYLQKAADLGVPLAQYDLAKVYGSNAYERYDFEETILKCAADQRFPPAAKDLSMIMEIDGNHLQAIKLHQLAIMGGGLKGSDSARALAGAFIGKKQYQKDLKTPTDPARAEAYKELEIALDGTESTSGNRFFKFPRLNEVLPLPPAQMPPWQGIYSAMSKEDAAYYQNPPNPDDLIREIKEAGVLIPKEYLTQPLLYKDNPRFKPEAEDKM